MRLHTKRAENPEALDDKLLPERRDIFSAFKILGNCIAGHFDSL
jgi:hypothetical protein